MVWAASVVLLGAGGIVTGVLVAKGPHKVVVISELARPYLAANVLIQSLGSPAPSGTTSEQWALAGDPLLGGSTTPRLKLSERSWLDSSGHLVPLARADAAAITAAQRVLAASVMTGGLLASAEQQLDAIVQAELGAHPHISSPGGASIAAWYGMSEHGSTASVDAAVYTWEQQDTLVDTPAGLRLTTSVNQAEVEGKATLRRVGGVWKVETLDQAPWQQAT